MRQKIKLDVQQEKNPEKQMDNCAKALMCLPESSTLTETSEGLPASHSGQYRSLSILNYIIPKRKVYFQRMNR